jgi:carnitine-CoA ligase
MCCGCQRAGSGGAHREGVLETLHHHAQGGVRTADRSACRTGGPMGDDAPPPIRDTVIDALHRATMACPDKRFLEFQGDDWSFMRFALTVRSYAHGLTGLGVAVGDTVIGFLDNGPEAVICWFAANRIGAIYVPVNTAFKGEFLRHQLRDSDAKVAVVHSQYTDRVRELGDELAALSTIVTCGDHTAALPGLNSLSWSDLDTGIDSPIDYMPAPTDISCLVYTSGTSGRAKGCMLSHNFICHVARQFNRFAGRTDEDHNFTTLPLFHLNAMAGSIVGSLLLKGSASIQTKFSVQSFWPEIVRTRATIVYMIGAMMPLLGKADDSEAMKAGFGQVRVVIAAPCPEVMRNLFQQRFGIKHVGGAGFGQTEIGMPFMTPPFEETKLATNGKLVPDFDALIVDEDDLPVPTGSVGEVVIRPLAPDIMFQGYWRRDNETVSAFRNLWYHTGDLGKFDNDGHFYFLDRKKDYLRRRGENISSFEVECVLASHPDVAEVAVHSVPSELTEDEVKATIVRRVGATVSEAEIAHWSVDQLPRFAVPRFIEFRKELPRNPVGRVLKYQLREDGVSHTTWDYDAASYATAPIVTRSSS